MKTYKIKVNGKVYEVEVEAVSESSAPIETQAQETVKETVTSQGANEILAPIAGKVLEIKVKEGDTVKKGQVVALVEAMKLENEIQSAYDGKVKQIVVSKGQDVRNKDVLIVLE